MSYIEADPNSPKKFSQQELAMLYQDSSGSKRNTGTNPYAPQMIRAEEYMSGET